MSVSGIGSMTNRIAEMGMRKPPTEAEMFKRADGNGDGSIDKVELSEAVSKISEMTGQSIDVDELLTGYDEDKDGVLNSGEMKKAMDSVRPEPPEGGMNPKGGMGGPGGMKGPPPGPPPARAGEEEESAAASTTEEEESATSLLELLKSLNLNAENADYWYNLLSQSGAEVAQASQVDIKT